VYVQTAGPSDFQNVSGISFLPANFTIDEDKNKFSQSCKLLDPGHTQFV